MLAAACHDKFLIEMVAVEVDGSILVDLPTHEYDAVLESHRKSGVVVAEDVQHSFDDGVVLRIHICVGKDIRS